MVSSPVLRSSKLLESSDAHRRAGVGAEEISAERAARDRHSLTGLDMHARLALRLNPALTVVQLQEQLTGKFLGDGVDASDQPGRLRCFCGPGGLLFALFGKAEVFV